MPNSSVRPVRSLDTKYVGSVDGRFVLPHRPIPAGTRPEIVACRLQGITPFEFTIASTHTARVGEALACTFDNIGPLQGEVIRLVTGGLVVAISADDAKRKDLAAKINWLKKRHVGQAKNHRAAARFKPRVDRCRCCIDGKEFAAQLVDVSVTGAAVITETLPPIGTSLHLGRIEGRVVRHLEQGFGVEFLLEQPPVTLMDDLGG